MIVFAKPEEHRGQAWLYVRPALLKVVYYEDISSCPSYTTHTEGHAQRLYFVLTKLPSRTDSN